MAFDDETLTAIDDALIAAAINPDHWPIAVSQIVAASGARGAVALPLKGRVPGVPMSRSVEDLAACYFENDWASRDYRTHGIPSLLKNGLFVDQDFATPEHMESSPFYADFLRPLGFQWSAGLLVDVAGDTWTLTLQRSPEQGLFTKDEQNSLRRLLVPLNRAAVLADQMGQARLGGMSDTLETLQSPSILLDRFGRVMRVSSRAELLLGEYLHLRLGELSTNDSQTNSILRAHISAAIWSEIRPDHPALKAVVIPRQYARPLILRAQPLRKAGLEYFDGCRAIITIADLEQSNELDVIILRQVYGLTLRETEICEVLFHGANLSEIAEQSGTSTLTVRTQMRSIFGKTQTRGQNELLLLLSRHVQI